MSTCCQPDGVNPSNKSPLDNNGVIDIVNSAYSARARNGINASYAKKVAQAFGYTEDELSSIPEGAHMGLSCGNPLAIASIKEGETVVDLGSGSGVDVLLAAQKVGPTGKAIGIDMSEDMIAIARRNAAKKGLKPPHVAFVRGQLTESLPFESNSVDCIISNCVINLLPMDGKASILKEAHRILKPGGRVVLNDIIAKKALPDSIQNDVVSYIGCVSGAILIEEYEAHLQSAGLTEIIFVDTKSDLTVYFQVVQDGEGEKASTTSCCTPAPLGHTAERPNYDINEWVASYQIYAVKDESPKAEVSPTALLRWWDAYPVVKSIPPSITAQEVATFIREKRTGFAVVDVRRNDHGGGHVRGSHNIHAQTFYDELPEVYDKFKNVSKVIFYCQSSNGRGPRCAGWYQDYLNLMGNTTSVAFVLKGGIKNWLAAFKGEEDLIDHDIQES